MKESETRELKKSTSELKEAIVSIVAILNKHQKGELYFGVGNDGKVKGQTVTENTIRKISQTFSQNVEPKIFPKINEVTIEGKKCVHVEFAGNNVPYYAYGRAYVRVGDEDRQLSAMELERMVVRKNKSELRWDRDICKGATLEDIDNDTIREFVDFTKQWKRLPVDKEDAKTILRKLKLMQGDKITNAGILLFGKHPTDFFENVLIRCGRFKGMLKEKFIDMKDLDGNLFQNIERAMAFLQEHLHLQATIKGMRREEKWEIPLEALREAIINALIHRDYKEPSFVYIKVYDEGIIIANPGKLPEGLSIDDLYKEHESKLRNPLLAKAFYYTGFIDVWGRGILNILHILEENNLPKPLFEQSGTAFRILFRRLPVQKTAAEELGEELGEKLGENQKRILELIQTDKFISIPKIAKEIGISTTAVERNLSKLKKKGILKRVGPAKGGHWKIIPRSDKI